MKLDSRALGGAFGVLWGLTMFILTILSAMNGYASDFLIMMAGIYPGFSLTYLGAVIGAIYGFIDGFIGGWLLGWLYNRFSR